MRERYGKLREAEVSCAFDALMAISASASQSIHDALPDDLRVQLDQAAPSLQVSNPMRTVS
ncbi:hypothetical protein CEQ23_39995 [Burkholderia cepacia]|nr:hypothetical protein CEQ23_39995 [Burkholderia cepacia]QCY08315.1 hypothetical protein EJ998_35450 [Burkholderia cepacia ATCC 25416]